MAADGRLPIDKLSAAGFAAGQVPVATGAGGFKPGSAGGGGTLGYAVLTITIAAPTSNGTAVNATAITTNVSEGDPDLSTSGGTITYCASGVPCIYVVTVYASITATTNALSTDVHQLRYDDGLFGAFTAAFVGTTASGPSMSLVNRYSTAFGSVSKLRAVCTGGTNRSYSLGSLNLYIARFPDA